MKAHGWLGGVGLALVSALLACGGGATRADGGAARDGGVTAADGGATFDGGTTGGDGGASGALRVYVAGESIEARNRFVEAPFLSTGALNERGGGANRNDNEEYGWMVPFAERLRLRDASLRVEFVGADEWSSADDGPYTGMFPAVPGRTSAISGTTIQSWLDQRTDELQQKTYCYDIALAARGGNDFGLEDDNEIKSQLKTLVRLLAAGSNCRANPIIYVTGHLPDDQRGGDDPPGATYVQQQIARFVTRFRDAVSELRVSDPAIRVRFIDMYTPFVENRRTTAFPSETWSTGGVPDYVKIGRDNDLMHPRRLACIYAGELVADAMDLTELRGLR
jgi:hypothetical protein